MTTEGGWDAEAAHANPVSEEPRPEPPQPTPYQSKPAPYTCKNGHKFRFPAYISAAQDETWRIAPFNVNVSGIVGPTVVVAVCPICGARV